MTQHVLLEEMWFGEERDKRTSGDYGIDTFKTGAFSVYGPEERELPVLKLPDKRYHTNLSRVNDDILQEAKTRVNVAAKAAQLLRHGLAYGDGENMKPILAFPRAAPMELGRRKKSAQQLIDEYEYEASSPEDDQDDWPATSVRRWEGRFPALQQALATLERPPRPIMGSRDSISPQKNGRKRKSTDSLEDPEVQSLPKRTRTEHRANLLRHSTRFPARFSSLDPATAGSEQVHHRPGLEMRFSEALNIAMAEQRKARGPSRDDSWDEMVEEDESSQRAARRRARQSHNDHAKPTSPILQRPVRTARVYTGSPYTTPIERYMARTLRRQFEGAQLAAHYNEVMQKAYPGIDVRTSKSLMSFTDEKTP